MDAITDIKNHINNKQIEQRQLFLHYQALKNGKQKLPLFQNTGFRVYSQNDEDGLLLYLFSLIGFTNRLLVDIAFGSPYGANTTNLICNWGFTGLLVEGNQAGVVATNQFFASHPDTFILPPRVQNYWVTAENINDILVVNEIYGEIDLFSLDVDGIDYWLWENLSIIQPRVVIAETSAFLGKEKSITVPYNPQFNRLDVHPEYFGASIAAFVKLGREKGYRMVACNRFGFNLIFVRNDLGTNVLPEISADECFYFLPPDLARRREEKCKAVADYKWIEV